MVGVGLFLIAALVFSASGMVDAKELERSESLRASLGKLPLPFIENRGQVHEDVAFYAKTFGGTVFVTKDGRLVYSLPEGNKGTEDLGREDKVSEVDGEKDIEPGKAAAFKESLVGGAIKEVKGEEPSRTKVNYFKGNDPSRWQSGVATYELVSLGEVYEGIEVKLRAYGKNVEKLFYVKPGADPSTIKVKVEGGEIRVNEKGELEVETELGVVRFTKPLAYQEVDGGRVEVTASYKMIEENKALYGFNVGEYDKTKTLVIDPLLACTFFGSDTGYTEEITGITTDNDGNVYVIGYTDSSNFPVTPGAFDPTNDNDRVDSFVSKLSSDLSRLLASTYFGGGRTDRGYGIAVAYNGNVVIT